MLILGIVFDGSIFPFPFAGFAAEAGEVAGFGEVPTRPELLLPGIEGFADTGGTDGLRAASAALGEARPVFCAGAAAFSTDAETPIARALADWASCSDFSRICRCLSSSFATIDRRSSGMGLFSYKPDRLVVNATQIRAEKLNVP